jgi:hypothetical protein
MGEVAFRRDTQCRCVRLKLGRQIALEAVPVAGIEGAQHPVQLARQQRAGGRAALRQ